MFVRAPMPSTVLVTRGLTGPAAALHGSMKTFSITWIVTHATVPSPAPATNEASP